MRLSKSWLTAATVVFMLFAMTSGFAANATTEVQVGTGSLKIGGFGQFTATAYDDPNDTPMQFKLRRARLLLVGTIIPDKVKFVVQTEGTGSPYVLDSKLLLSYIPKTTLTLGRFLPNFTMYMPYYPAKIPTYTYPMTTLKYAMWRQSGIQSTTKLTYVDLTFGIYNGYQADLKGNDWDDNNDAKDFLARVDIKPMKNMKIGMFAWLGSPYDAAEDEDYDANRFGANVEWKSDFVRLAGEYVTGTIQKSASASDVDSFAMMVEAFFYVGDNWEILLRDGLYDDDNDAKEGKYTLGVNYKILKYNTVFQLNYIYTDKDYFDSDGHLLDDNSSEIVFQAQYMF